MECKTLCPDVRLIDKRGVAEMLGCSVRQVDSLREKEGLPFVKVGNLVKFIPEHVRAWILAKEVNGGKKGER